MASKGFIAALASIALAAGLAYKTVEYRATHDGPLKIVRYEPQKAHASDVYDMLSGKKAALYFSAVWCHPCKQFLPTVKENAKSSDIDWHYVDVTQRHNQDIARMFEVFTGNPPAYQLPHIVFLEKGKKIGESKGTMTKEELENKIKEIYKK